MSTSGAAPGATEASVVLDTASLLLFLATYM
jgi:hypothetical protein